MMIKKTREEKRRRRTKIVCTIGPASGSEGMIERLARAGMDCARLNFSHGTHAEHLQTIRIIRNVSAKIGKQIAVLQDLPGPKFRLGNLRNGSVILRKGERVTLATTGEEDKEGKVEEEEEGENEKRIPLRQNELPRFVFPGSTIFFSDGSIKLKVLGTTDTEIRCICQTSGQVFSGKGVNIPKLRKDFKTFTEQDKQHVLFGLENGVDLIAVSFVRNSRDIEIVREFVAEKLRSRTKEHKVRGEEGERGEKREANSKVTTTGAATLVAKTKTSTELPSIVAKIEKKDAIGDIEGIVKTSDLVMVARGDLGVENPIEQVPIVQKTIIATCNRFAVPVITATQILESMVNNPTPTRAEVTDIANAIFDGTDALMLSEETAVGQHPVECVNVLRKVALTTERRLLLASQNQYSNYHDYASNGGLIRKRSWDVRDASCEAANQISLNIGAKLIVSPTNRGTMTARISRFRPRAPIIAITESEKTLRKLGLVWGVHPFRVEKRGNLTQLLDASVRKLIEEKLVQKGDRIVLVCDNVKLSKQTGELLFVVEME